MKDFPEGNTKIQESDTADSASDPTGRDHRLYSMNAGRARSIQQKKVVAPVADAPHAVRPPGPYREKGPNLKAQDDIKNDAELR